MTDQMSAPDETGAFYDDEYGSVSSGTTAPHVHYVNEAGVSEEVVDDLRHNREIASVIEKWSQSLSQASSNQPSLDLFNRNRWDDAKHIHAQMSQCAWAVENDDILSTLADVLEGLMFQKCRFELFDEDQQDMWNQWAADVDLDTRLRQQARELYKVSQFYIGLWWERRVYSMRESSIRETIDEFEVEREKREAEERRKEAKLTGMPEPPELDEPSGPGRGNRKRKKKFPVEVPTEMTIFDPTKVLPVGTLMFGRERFAYIASREEDNAFSQVMTGDIADGTVLQLIERKYEPTDVDKAACQDLGIDPNRLWLFKQDAIFRHTLTRAEYERYAPVRLKSVLPILEMKQHLRAADRAALIGTTNFIVVITKGTDKLPAKPAEISNLQEQSRVIARLPVLVGDHRLKVEIVAPDLTNTMIESRWQVLDSRLVFKALQSYSPVVQGGNSAGTGVSEMSRVIARSLESRRHMLVRAMERAIFRKVVERNSGVLDEQPTLAFTPKRITLDFKAEILGQILKLRDRGDISRETMLEDMDYDQDVEVLRRARERVEYDRVFNSSTPHASPATQPFQAGGQSGGQGGNVGPNGQPRTEGGRPSSVPEDEPRRKS